MARPTTWEAGEASAPRRARPWFLLLTDAAPIGPVWVGAGVSGALLLGLFALRPPGSFAPAGLPAHVGLQIQAYFCLATGYLIAALALAERGSLRELEGLCAALPGLRARHDELRRGLTRFSLRGMLAAIVVGQILNLLVSLAAGAGLASLAFTPNDVLPFLMWLVLAPTVYAMLAQAALFRHLGEGVDVELFDFRPLRCFVRAGLRFAAVFAFGTALAIPLHVDWTTGTLPLYILAPIAVSVPINLALALLPVWGVHRRLRAAKHEELDRVAAAIRGEPGALSGSALAAHASELRGVALLDYRDRVASVREWPFDAPALRRLGFFLLVPPLGWLGGALVERSLDVLLG